MKTRMDLTGRRYGRFTVVRRQNDDDPGNARWLCRCDCGFHRNLFQLNMTAGVAAYSCGCIPRAKRKTRIE